MPKKIISLDELSRFKSDYDASLKTLNGLVLYGGGNYTFDDELDNVSTNAVQNKVLNSELVDIKYRLAVLEEAILSEDTLSYTYLQSALIPNVSDNSYPIIASAGLDMVDIKGHSFVYNQLVQNGNFANSTNNWYAQNSTIAIVSGKMVATSTVSGDTYGIRQFLSATIPSGHKIYFRAKCSTTTQNVTPPIFEIPGLSSSDTPQYSDGICYSLATLNANATYFDFKIAGGNVANVQVGDTITIEYIEIFDLTAMGLDSVTTVDETIALLQQNGINPYEYNEYNVGKIIDSKPTAIVSRGYNLFNDNWKIGNVNLESLTTDACACVDYISVVPNKTYLLEVADFGYTPTIYVLEYDENYNLLLQTNSFSNSKTTTVSENTKYIKFYLYRANYNFTNNFPQVCLHLTGTRTGYAPYKAPITYSLSTPIFRSAGSVQDNTKKVNIGVVDLGTLTWRMSGTGSTAFFYANDVSDYTNAGNNENLICAKYTRAGVSSSDTTDKIIGWAGNGSQLRVRDSAYTDYDTFKSAMNGVYAYLPLATPTDQPTISLPENIEIELGGSLEVVYDNGYTTPCDFTFNTAVYKPIQ